VTWRAALLLCLSGCGGGWGAADTKSVADIAKESQAQLALCAEDAGSCNAAQIRATARLDLRLACSLLYSHGGDVPDAGDVCTP
jgi:hypothetical protein